MPGTIGKICQKVFHTCPEAFTVDLNDCQVSCLPQFTRALTNALGYIKAIEGSKASKKKRSAVPDDDPDDPDSAEVSINS